MAESPKPPKLQKLAPVRPKLTLTKQKHSARLHSQLLQMKLESYLSLYTIIGTKISRAALLSQSEVNVLRDRIDRLKAAVCRWEAIGGGKLLDDSHNCKPLMGTEQQKPSDDELDASFHEITDQLHQLQLVISSHQASFVDEAERDWPEHEQIARFGVRLKYLQMLKDYHNQRSDKVYPLFFRFLKQSGNISVIPKMPRLQSDLEPDIPEFVKWIIAQAAEGCDASRELIKYVGGHEYGTEELSVSGKRIETTLKDWLIRFAGNYIDSDPPSIDPLNFLSPGDDIETRVALTLSSEFETKEKLTEWMNSVSQKSSLSAIEMSKLHEKAIVLYVCNPIKLSELCGMDPSLLVSKSVFSDSEIGKAAELAQSAVAKFLIEHLPPKYQSSGL